MADTKISALASATTPLVGTEVLPIVQSGATVKVTNNDLRPKQIQSNATSGVLQIVGPAAAATRVMTVPDANFTAARTDAAQSFTGVQTFSNGFVAGGPGVSPAGKFTATGGNTQITLEDATNSKLGYLFQSNDVLYYYNNALTKQVQVDADFKFFAGNFVPSTAAKGVNFTANTGAAGMTSQLLNWYEEGTWTPTLQGGTTAGSYTVSTTTAKYTRIGRQVTVTAGMTITVNSAGTGAAKFGGLPFNKGSDQFLSGSVYTSSVTYGAGVIAVNVQAWTSSSSADFALVGVESGTTPYDVLITDFVTGSIVYITVTYFV